MDERLKQRRDELHHEQGRLRRKMERVSRELAMVEAGTMPPDREDEWYVPPFLRFNEDLVREDDAWDRAWDEKTHTATEYQAEIRSLRARVRIYLSDIWRLKHGTAPGAADSASRQDG